MDTVVAESGITLDARLLGENVIVLAFEVSYDFREATEISKRARGDSFVHFTLLRCQSDHRIQEYLLS
jgi:hypothetical protein